MTTALTTLRQRAGRELDVMDIINNADITAIGASTITAANFLRNTLWPPTRYSDKNTVAYRAGSATAADNERFVLDLANSTGIITVTGTYADTTVGSEAVELWYNGVRPGREVLDSLNRVLEDEFVTSMHLLSAGSRVDYGMEKTTDSDWTDVGSPGTSSKVTSATRATPIGPRIYDLINASANEGTRSSGIVVGQSRTVSAYAVVTANVGTASFQLYNGTSGNTTDMGSAVTAAYRTPVFLTIQNQTVASTCKLVQLNMLGQESNADIQWNAVALYKHDSSMIQLPSFITEGFMAPRLYVGMPRVSLAANVYDAESMDYVPLVERQDYRLVINHYDVEPYKVQIVNESLIGQPIFVEYRRPLSDFTTFAAESDTTAGPLHSIMPKFKKDLLTTVYKPSSNRIAKEDWQVFLNKAEAEIKRSQAARPIMPQGPAVPYYATRQVY